MMNPKQLLIFALLLLSCSIAAGQQLPYFTQTNSNYYLLNPAVTGTKKLIDLRVNYRTQWVGFEGAPRTQSISLHSRFLKGMMGLGGFIYKDETGPVKHLNYCVSYAFHARFPDVELSIGLSGNMMRYFLDGTQATIHNTHDKAVDRSIIASDWVPNANAGVYLYNDRFHFGASVLNLMESPADFYEADTLKKGKLGTEAHTFISLGYNFETGPDYIWEHTLQACALTGAPLLVDYNLRIHMKEQLFGGLSVRLKDAVALQAGYTWKKQLQIGYSYDFIVSRLRPHQSGSHEVVLIYRSDIFNNKRKNNLDEFLRQKYDLF
jgi:type IX secretion system PorP/SprF family membrane protein